MNHSARISFGGGKMNRGIGFIVAVEAGRSADQDARHVALAHQFRAFRQAVAPVVARQHYGDIGLGGAFIVNQRGADGGKPDIPGKEGNDDQKQQKQEKI